LKRPKIPAIHFETSTRDCIFYFFYCF